MRILLTGASGTLGRSLLPKLAQNDQHTVIAATTIAYEDAQRYWGLTAEELSRVVIIPRGHALARDSSTGPVDLLVNMAWPRGLGGEALGRGMRFHTKLLQAQRDAHAIINISSQSVYSTQRREPAKEYDPLDLDTPYAAGKYAVELLSTALSENTNVMNLRLASLASPYLPTRIINRLTESALAGEDIEITGGDQVFDLMDARDAASAIAALIDSGSLSGCQTLNVGSSSPKTLYQIATTVTAVVAEKTGTKVQVHLTSGGEYVSSALDTTRLQSQVRFTPEFSLEQTVSTIIDHLKRN